MKFFLGGYLLGIASTIALIAVWLHIQTVLRRASACMASDTDPPPDDPILSQTPREAPWGEPPTVTWAGPEQPPVIDPAKSRSRNAPSNPASKSVRYMSLEDLMRYHGGEP